jgi:transposase
VPGRSTGRSERHRGRRSAQDCPPGHRRRPQRKAIARSLIADIRRLDQTAKTLERQLREVVAASGSTLTEIHGLAAITAAKILPLTGDVRRFPDQHRYASHAGTAPIDASGDQVRHRLSRRGNRQLNAAIHVVAVSQARDPGPGREYYLRKIAEGKTPNEARRSLKRRLSNAVYHRLINDLSQATKTATCELCQGSWTVPRVADHAAVAAVRWSVRASDGVRYFSDECSRRRL